jgi:hypothetical protein
MACLRSERWSAPPHALLALQTCLCLWHARSVLVCYTAACRLLGQTARCAAASCWPCRDGSVAGALLGRSSTAHAGSHSTDMLAPGIRACAHASSRRLCLVTWHGCCASSTTLLVLGRCMGSCVNAPMIAIADYTKGVEGFSYNYYEVCRLLASLKASAAPVLPLCPGSVAGCGRCC